LADALERWISAYENMEQFAMSMIWNYLVSREMASIDKQIIET
jgi:hypothetical protein